MPPLSLQAIHGAEVSDFAERASSVKKIIEKELLDKSAISGVELTVRVLYLGDKNLPLRMAWLHRIIASFDHRLIREDIELSLTQAGSYFDCILVHGSDTRRVKQVVRKIHSIIPGKLLFCLLDEGNPRTIAELLNRGVDDVFYPEMDESEARARMRAAYRRRFGLSRHREEVEMGEMPIADDLLIRRVEADVQCGALGRRERVVLRALLSNDKHFMSYEQLSEVIGREVRSAPTRTTKNLLAVTISRIRVKLPDYLSIINDERGGYSVIFK